MEPRTSSNASSNQQPTSISFCKKNDETASQLSGTDACHRSQRPWANAEGLGKLSTYISFTFCTARPSTAASKFHSRGQSLTS
eukprot:scaffold35170_cov80-Skeletonema_marinoi.AAC.1